MSKPDIVQLKSLTTDQLGLDPKAVAKTIDLLNEGATIPFIARYRKEATGSLDEIAIEKIKATYDHLLELVKRKETIIKAITEQDALTPALRSQIEECWDKLLLEDIYLPYKRKAKTYASIARSQGLEPLAKIIMVQKTNNLLADAKRFVKGKVPDVGAALQGARHIISEWVSENAGFRAVVRRTFDMSAIISSKVVASKKKEAAKYEPYFKSQEALKKCPSHRLLAMLRGEREGLLRVKLTIDDGYAYAHITRHLHKGHNRTCQQHISEAVQDALDRLIIPSIENEARKAAKKKADEEAIVVFGSNLKNLLLAPPLGEKIVMGIDPGFKSGCKVVVLDTTGSLLHNETIYPHPPASKVEVAEGRLFSMVEKYAVSAIAIGNGTAGRETYSVLKKIKFHSHPELHFVNESGASIYSASKIAREEFPDHDLTVRGAVSIARRLMDPMAELVKIDPKSIGVGQYQHDVDQKLLQERLASTISFCVNAVGINVNTASKSLLSHVSGIGPVLAENIVNHRNDHHSFQTRQQLKEVPRMGNKAMELCTGFLRIKDGDDPLDDTGVHPESYPIVHGMAQSLKLKVSDLISQPDILAKINLQEHVTEKAGLPTLRDIIQELEKPGHDPRGTAKEVKFSQTITTIKDLKVGMILTGIVNNVTKFGAFVDIGVKESGLVHISQIVDRFITDPSEFLSVQQEVRVKVMEVDVEKKRISLSIKAV